MITVLRIGHRIHRDKRITTHVALVARAFGADKIVIAAEDRKIEDNIRGVCQKFGGDFQIQVGVDAKKLIRQWKGIVVHLTMYGEELEESISKIDRNKDLLIVVGSEKVPSFVYHLADFNISVGNQPHSEVAALAVFLDRFLEGKWLKKRFNGDFKIIPSSRGKKVVSKKAGVNYGFRFKS